MRYYRLISIVLFAVMLSCSFDGLAQESKPKKSDAVTIELMNGDKIVGTLLQRDAKKLFVHVGGEVVAIDQQNVEAILDANKTSDEVDNVKDFELYKTGERVVKNVAKMIGELAQAIVIVKTPSGLGTGWFCNKKGYLITNNHVVAGEKSITVTMFVKDGDGYGKKIFKKVRIVALNDNIDLALLKIEEKIDVPYPQLYIGDSTKLEVGDPVFAIGNPMNLERSTSQGNVSKAARNQGGRLYIQTTAPIAPGNSGGPLFNERGEVVGVVNMGYIMLDGLGFAIPSKYVKEFLDNVESFAYDQDNPNSGLQYMEAPVTATDKSFAFLSADYIKVGDGVTCLTLADLDGNGVKEIVYVNNPKSEIGYMKLKEKKESQDEAIDYEDINRLKDSEYFTPSTIPVLSHISSLAVSDLNGDKRPDIVFLGDIDGLAVLEQKKDGTFKKARKIDDLGKTSRREALRIADIDNDGENDILALGTDSLSVFWSGKERKDYALGSNYKSAIIDFSLIDINNDRLMDILFHVVGKQYATYARVQNQNHEFVEDIPIKSHLSGVTRSYNGKESRKVVTLDNGLNRVRLLSLMTEKPEEQGAIPTSLLTIPVDPNANITSDVECDRIDGKKLASLLAVDRQKNEFLVCSYDPKTGFTMVKSPAPSMVDQTELYVSKNRAAVFSFSAKDRIFGVSRIKQGQVSFPRPINTDGKIRFIRMRKAPGGEDKGAKLIWMEELNSMYYIRCADADTLVDKVYANDEGSIDVETSTLSFKGSRGQEDHLMDLPADLEFADFNGDKELDLVIYWAYSGKESLYLGEGGNVFREIIMNQEFLEDKKDQPLIVADIDNDGKNDVLLIKPGFVRVLRVDEKDKLYVAKQFNWEFDKVTHFARYDTDGKIPVFVAISGTQAKLVKLDTDKNRFDLLAKLDLTGIEVGKVMVAKVANKKRNDVIILGKGVINVFTDLPEEYVQKEQVMFNADLEHFIYWNIFTADLDGDKQDEIMLFDSKKSMFEVYRANDNNELNILLRHRLFEKTIFQRSHSNAQQIPQELDVGDVDGDGKPDFVCLLWDRIAVYLQADKH